MERQVLTFDSDTQDHSCIDQKSPMPGVSALPMIVAQCNALISLVDESYSDRAWCSVEVILVQKLRKTYGLHLWYEHTSVPAQSGGNSGSQAYGNPMPTSDTSNSSWALVPGPLDLLIVMSEKKLTFESDRPKQLKTSIVLRVLGIETECSQRLAAVRIKAIVVGTELGNGRDIEVNYQPIFEVIGRGFRRGTMAIGFGDVRCAVSHSCRRNNASSG